MVFCHPDCLPFMPSAWQDLVQVDREIVAEFKADEKARHVFMKWLSTLPCYWQESFIQRHSRLCKDTVDCMTPSERIRFRYTTSRISNIISFENRNSTVFWADSERVALPASWQLAAQEGRLLAQIHTNYEDFRRLVEGLLKKPLLLVLDYPNVALAAIKMAVQLDPVNQKLITRCQQIDDCYTAMAKTRKGNNFV